MFVGESAPASGRQCYLANSGLFDWTRQSFERVYGRRTPDGDDFLAFLQSAGTWLIALVDTPVNRLVEGERRRPTSTGQGRMAKLINQANPQIVVSFKKEHAAPCGRCLRRFWSSVIFATPPFYQVEARLDWCRRLNANHGVAIDEAKAARASWPVVQLSALHTTDSRAAFLDAVGWATKRLSVEGERT